MSQLWLNHSYRVSFASLREAILFEKENRMLILMVFSSSQFSHSVMSHSLWPHGLQHTIPRSPSPIPRACSNSCPSSQSHTLSSPSPPAFSLPQHEGLFQWVNSSHEVAKVLELQLQHVLPMNIQDWFPWGLTGLIYLLSKGLWRVFTNTTVEKHQFFGSPLSL